MNGENSQPIGTYRERSPFANREFALFANKITIRGKNRRGDYVHHIPLEQLSPDVGTQMLSKSNPLFLILIGALLSALVVLLLAERFTQIPSFFWAMVAILVLVPLCSLGSILTRRKFPAYHFFNTHGVIVLDMIEAGPEKENCRAFTELVSQTIKNLRGL